MKKARRVILSTMLGIGMIFLIAGLVVGQVYAAQSKGMVAVDGVIADIRHGNPVIAYQAGGRTYTVEGVVSSSSQRLGDPYSLMVDPDDPSRAADPGMLTLQWILAGVGGLMALAGIITWAVMDAGERRRADLLGYGRWAQGTITALKENRSVSMGSMHPWVATATCVHPLTGETVTLRSHLLWTKCVSVGQQVNIAFDPIDEKKYAFDLRDSEESVCP